MNEEIDSIGINSKKMCEDEDEYKTLKDLNPELGEDHTVLADIPMEAIVRKKKNSYSNQYEEGPVMLRYTYKPTNYEPDNSECVVKYYNKKCFPLKDINNHTKTPLPDWAYECINDFLELGPDNGVRNEFQCEKHGRIKLGYHIQSCNTHSGPDTDRFGSRCGYWGELTELHEFELTEERSGSKKQCNEN